ncbi:MAG: CRISPR-associated endonuclease Cas4g/Cas1g [Nitriliruptorales bacterium]
MEPLTTSHVEIPDLLPARMLNEYAYCPRLFFLEWVQQQWADSADTSEGSYHHRRVDEERGRAPLPEDDGELIRAQSLSLSSPTLGLAAKVDVVEGGDGSVRPIDTKRGKPPNVPEGAYEPERVQLCVQGLLLREAGYRCDEGVLYFAGARKRVTVPFDDALVTRTLELLDEAREVASRDVPPPPLVDSPKCPRCSLVGICLPDEINTLADRTVQPRRRLVPRDPASRPLYVTEQGAYVSVRKGRVEVRKEGVELASVRLIDVSQVCLIGNVQVSTQAFRGFFAAEIPVCFFSYGGWLSGIAEGLPSKHVELRRRQVIEGAKGGLEAARRFVVGKIANSRTLLRRNTREDPKDVVERLRVLQFAAGEAETVQALLGIEGAAARDYFGAFATMLRPDLRLPGSVFTFEGRNRRPPRDPVNALLSYVYGLLVKDLVATTLAVGFDPYIGLYHRPRFGRPALALDLAEEFRPLVGDSVVIQVLNNGEVGPTDFLVRAGGVTLTKEGRRAVIAAYERRLDVELTHPWFGYKVSYRRLLEVQARILAAYLLGEVPEYAPVVTR